MRMATIVCVLVGLAASGLGSAGAATLVLTPSQDNTIYENVHNFSNGVGESIFAGTNAITSPRRGLLAFDISGIAPGSQITSVTLELTATVSATVAARAVSLHKATSDWGESSSDAGGGVGPGSGGGDGIIAEPGDATWSHGFYDTDHWTSTGGDFVATASASTDVTTAPAAYVWDSTPTLVADVQSWVDDAGSNFGWFLIGRENQNRTATGFSSKDHSEPLQWPQLTVEYTPSIPTLESSVGELKSVFGPK